MNHRHPYATPVKIASIILALVLLAPAPVLGGCLMKSQMEESSADCCCCKKADEQQGPVIGWANECCTPFSLETLPIGAVHQLPIVPERTWTSYSYDSVIRTTFALSENGPAKILQASLPPPRGPTLLTRICRSNR